MDYKGEFRLGNWTKLVAKKVSDFLKQSADRFQKTIVFCVDREHASRVRRAFLNKNSDLCGQDSQPLTQKIVQGTVRRVAVKANVRPGVHILRHSFCSILAMTSVSARSRIRPQK